MLYALRLHLPRHLLLGQIQVPDFAADNHRKPTKIKQRRDRPVTFWKRNLWESEKLFVGNEGKVIQRRI